jgi:hypothetical protein
MKGSFKNWLSIWKYRQSGNKDEKTILYYFHKYRWLKRKDFVFYELMFSKNFYTNKKASFPRGFFQN